MADLVLIHPGKLQIEIPDLHQLLITGMIQELLAQREHKLTNNNSRFELVDEKELKVTTFWEDWTNVEQVVLQLVLNFLIDAVKSSRITIANTTKI